MNIHEYQAKEILSRYSVPIPSGRVAATPEEVEEIARDLGGVCMVKAQIHAGGRGKVGGVKLAKTPEDARRAAQALLGKKLVTHQTGPEGRTVKKVLVEEQCRIAGEFYLCLTVDRRQGEVTIMGSSQGGTEIEGVARTSPGKILLEPIDPAVGIQSFQVRKVALGLGFPKEALSQSMTLLRAVYQAFIQCDCSLIELNPLVLLQDASLLALDAKIGFDPNALYRHPELESLRDLDEEDPREVEARRHQLSYIALDGQIGCMVNGAGLAMATMDIIKHYGGEPANFLDVGGGASVEKVREGFKIVLSDPRVKALLVNIFGGIMRCDVIANGIVTGARQANRRVPLVVRLEGTNAEEGRRILTDSGLPIITAQTMAEGAEKIVNAVKGF
jgi:succinyl-CoA synthetase beta subunit